MGHLWPSQRTNLIAAALIAAFRAAFFDAKASKLRRGERATVMCLATDREQAGRSCSTTFAPISTIFHC